MKVNATKYTLLTIGFLVFNISLAQKTEFKNEIGIHTGYSFGALKNLNLAPVSIYNYQSPFFEINYLRHTKKHRIFEVNYQHWSSELKSERIPELNLAYNCDRLNFNVLYPVLDQDKLIFHVGFLTQTVGSAYGDEVVVFEAQQKLAIAGRVSYRAGDKHLITSQLSIPMVFFVFGNLDTALYLSNEYQGYIFSVEYQYSLSDRFSITSQFHGFYDRVQSDNVFRELQNRITIGTKFKF